MAKNSSKRIASNNKWTNAHYERVNLAMPIGTKERIKKAAKQGESLNAYCNRAIAEKLKQDEAIQ